MVFTRSEVCVVRRSSGTSLTRALLLRDRSYSHVVLLHRAISARPIPIVGFASDPMIVSNRQVVGIIALLSSAIDWR